MDEVSKAKTRLNVLAREERLAASLRENLKRRKVQARAQASESRAVGGQDAAALPKADTKSL